MKMLSGVLLWKYECFIQGKGEGKKEAELTKADTEALKEVTGLSKNFLGQLEEPSDIKELDLSLFFSNVQVIGPSFLSPSGPHIEILCMSPMSQLSEIGRSFGYGLSKLVYVDFSGDFPSLTSLPDNFFASCASLRAINFGQKATNISSVGCNFAMLCPLLESFDFLPFANCKFVGTGFCFSSGEKNSNKGVLRFENLTSLSNAARHIEDEDLRASVRRAVQRDQVLMLVASIAFKSSSLHSKKLANALLEVYNIRTLSLMFLLRE